MAIVDVLLSEFDQEMAVTRKVIERVDSSKLGWQPHEKSMSLGRLAGHVAEVPQWGFSILSEPEYNMVRGDYKPTTYTNVDEILAAHDATTAKVRAALAGQSDADLMAIWTFKLDGQARFAMPRVAAWRSWVMNHLIHHRGQLSVYLRQTGSKVPAIYGPSGDEQV
jgi:uncharacterized damage-inducible protein DinB